MARAVATPISGDGITQGYNITESGRYSIEVNRTDGSTTYIEDYSTPIWLTYVPSNEFKVQSAARATPRRARRRSPSRSWAQASLKLSGKDLASQSASPEKSSKVDLVVKPTPADEEAEEEGQADHQANDQLHA